MMLISPCWTLFWIAFSPQKDNMTLPEKMMFEGDDREDYAAWMEETKGVFIKPNSGAAMTFEEEKVDELEDIDFV